MKRRKVSRMGGSAQALRLLLVCFAFSWSLVTGHWSLQVASAAQLPSLFRGIVVADLSVNGAGSPLGIRIISVEEHSQAALADLRPEDLIVQVNETPIRSIDEFALVSATLKGKATQAKVLVLRHGQPLERLLHLYSSPILHGWELSFVPEHDIRFAEPSAGLQYWMRLGRGFETAGKLEPALNAYLNALHHEPTNPAVALKADELLWRIAQARLNNQQLAEAVTAIQQATTLLRRLFDQSLEESQLRVVRGQLTATLQALQRRK